MLFSCCMKHIYKRTYNIKVVIFVGVDSEGNLFTGIMTFIINSLKQSISFVIKTIPKVKVMVLWLSEETDECIHTLHQSGFNDVSFISDNHSINVSAFNILIKKYPHTRKVSILLTTRQI